VIIGTSAGATVGAQVTSGVSLEELFATQLDPAHPEIPARLSRSAMLWFLLAALPLGDRRRGLSLLGRAALRAATPSEPRRRAVIEQRLPNHGWPSQALRITAVDARTGEFTVFDSNSGVPLVDAVAASCAVPLVWPPVTINGRRYMDGGARTVANVDLAAGYERVVAIAPLTAALRPADRPARQLERLDTRHKLLLTPNPASQQAMGRDSLDPSRRRPSAESGRAQAEDVAQSIRGVWLGS
jgi:NTE family protein